MRNVLIIMQCCFFLFSCASDNPSIQREGESDISIIQDDDVEMNAAIEVARQTLNTFKSLLVSDSAANYKLSVKVMFEGEEGTEHLWLADVELNGLKLSGTIDNEPIVENIAYGQSIEIDDSKISDWIAMENISGKIIGGYTLKVLRNRMSEKERFQFDQDNGFVFE